MVTSTNMNELPAFSFESCNNFTTSHFLMIDTVHTKDQVDIRSHSFQLSVKNYINGYALFSFPRFAKAETRVSLK
jgi:hypothetical protein